MADIVADKQAKTIDISDKLQGYSRVIIRTGQTDENGNEIAYIAGAETGRTLEIDNPWGNQAVADNILARIQGWAYQPMDASSVKLPPAFELGDSIVVNNVFSGVYEARVRFSSVFAGDVDAPLDKEIDHEYQYEDSKERKYNRKIDAAVARLNFFSDSIEAKVDKVSEGATFGWRLTENGWSVFNQQGNLFSVDAGGASVTGEIKASSGSIGGFTVGSNGIYNNQSSFGGQEQNGVYIGTDGIQLGTRFRVDSYGNLYAASGTFDGAVYASNIKSTAIDGYGGYFNGSGISQYSLTGDQMSYLIRGSLGYADFSNEVFNNRDSAPYIKCDYFVAQQACQARRYYVDLGDGEYSGSINNHTHYVTVSGNQVTIGRPDFTGANHPFEIAPSDVTLAQTSGATYRDRDRVFSIPVKAVDASGNVLASANFEVSAWSQIQSAYNNGYNVGYNDGQNEAITEIYITAVSGSSAGVRAYHGDVPYTFKWVNVGASWNGW